MIHSFAFVPGFDVEGMLISVLFNSDRTRRQYLYSILVNEIISLLEEVGSNDPASLHCQLNLKTGNYDVKVGPTMDDFVGDSVPKLATKDLG